MLRKPRINSRSVILLAAIALPLFWYGYVLADQLIYHGIKPHNGWTDVDLRTLGCFNFNPETDDLKQVPARFRALDGKRIALQGVMVASDDAGDFVDHFQFVYNKQVCCIGGPPRVQERVFARCTGRDRVRYYDNRPVQLMGVLHARIERDEIGVVTAVYELDVESVEPL